MMLRLIIVSLLSLLLGSAHAADPYDIAPITPARVVSTDYFGTHFHRLGHAERRWAATQWPAGMIGALRLWDSTTRWADIEPSRGNFAFDRLDDHVAQAQAGGASVMLVLGSPARWASARPTEYGPYGPGSAAEPRDLDDWDRYVTAVARRYKGRIALYELWNEPYFFDLPDDRDKPSAFFTGSVATLVELARRARAVLAREDPQAQLLTPGFVGATNRLDLFLGAGGKRYVDAVAYHFYAEDDLEFIRLNADVRAVMARHGMGRRALYNTESGYAVRGVEGQPLPDGMSRVDRRTAATLLARAMILGAYIGVERYYQYAWDNGRMGMLLEDGRTATDSLRAYASVRQWLLGTTLQGCRSPAPQTVRCAGWRGGENVVIAWQTEAGKRRVLAVPGGLEGVRLEHATEGTARPEIGPSGTLVLPADGMPVALWTRRVSHGRYAGRVASAVP